MSYCPETMFFILPLTFWECVSEDWVQYEYYASLKFTEQPPKVIYRQDKTLSSLYYTEIKQVKAEIKNDKERKEI